MATKLELLRAREAALKNEHARLDAAVEQLDDHSSLLEVERLSNSLQIVEGQLAAVRSEIDALVADEARAAEQAQAEEKAGLLAIGERGNISALP